jgi:hypothetical protein
MMEELYTRTREMEDEYENDMEDVSGDAKSDVPLS